MVAAAVEQNTNEEMAWKTSEEMASCLGVTVRTIRNMVARGELDRKRLHGRVYVRETQSPIQEVTHLTRVEPLADPAVVEMVTTLQQQLIRASQDFADRIQSLNDNLTEQKVAKERYMAKVSELETAADNTGRGMDQERITYRTEMAKQIRRHNTEMTRVVANSATERAQEKGRFKATVWGGLLLAVSLMGVAFLLGATLEDAKVIDATRLHLWAQGPNLDPAGLIFTGVVACLSMVGIWGFLRAGRA